MEEESPSPAPRNCDEFVFEGVPKIKAIIFCEFDTLKGPVMLNHVCAEGFDLDSVFNEGRFQSFSSALIPRAELFYRIVKVAIPGHSVISFPCGLRFDTYPRDTYTFNMCFVVPRDDKNTDSVYEPIVQKCAEYLIELEQDHFFLSNQDNRARVINLMSTILEKLNEEGECVVSVMEAYTIYLKICPIDHGIEPALLPPILYVTSTSINVITHNEVRYVEVPQYMVPIWTRQIEIGEQMMSQMDMLTQKIISCIDGVRCIKDISTKVNISPDLVARCIRNLHYFECVSLVPLFLYGNTYVATEKLHEFFNDLDEIEECLDFVHLKKRQTPNGPYLPVGERPKFCDVFRLYINLKCAEKLSDWVVANEPRKYNVDERKLIQFGMHKKFLRKLSVYPLLAVDDTTDPNKEIRNSNAGKHCDGTHAMEDLAVLLEVPPSDLQKIFQGSKKFQFIAR